MFLKSLAFKPKGFQTKIKKIKLEEIMYRSHISHYLNDHRNLCYNLVKNELLLDNHNITFSHKLFQSESPVD